MTLHKGCPSTFLKQMQKLEQHFRYLTSSLSAISGLPRGSEIIAFRGLAACHGLTDRTEWHARLARRVYTEHQLSAGRTTLLGLPCTSWVAWMPRCHPVNQHIYTAHAFSDQNPMCLTVGQCIVPAYHLGVTVSASRRC